MTSGDGSTAAMNNQMSYWGSNTVLPAGVEIWATNSYSALLPREELCHQGLLSPMPSGNKARPHFLRISEVIHRVGVSRPTIYRWMRGHLPQANRHRRTLSSGWSPTSPSGWKTRWQRGELLSSSLSGAHKLCGEGGNLIFASNLSQAESACISDHSE